MQGQAVVLHEPRTLSVEALGLTEPAPGEIVVDVAHSGISTGTEQLFWSGRMPPFPGMSYPLVPGYEAVGEVVEAPRASRVRTGDAVFVPGSSCFRDAAGLFGGAASRLVTSPDRVARVDAGIGAEGALLALAATARHAIAGRGRVVPDLIVGHGVLGRLLARLTLAAGGPAPTVWEVEPSRMEGAHGYEVVRPEADERRDYRAIYDASGRGDILNDLIGRLAKGGEIVLAGFYAEPLAFAFPPAFMREVRLRVAAEWTPDDMIATRMLVESGALSLSGLVTHRRPARDAAAAYATAFSDPACLKMIIDWKDAS